MVAIRKGMSFRQRMDQRFQEAKMKKSHREALIENTEDLLGVLGETLATKENLKSERIITLTAFFGGNLALIGALIKLLGD